jgi:heme/copper-type cytochrome/quinol oxidase subunit 1
MSINIPTSLINCDYRWIMSTNHKDIGTLLSILIRIELAATTTKNQIFDIRNKDS